MGATISTVSIPPDLRKDVIRLMVKSAKKGQPITYGEIMRKCRIPRGQPTRNGKAIGEVVGNISEWTFKTWRMYLSAIVVQANTGYPSGGFFGLSGIPQRFVRDENRWSSRLTDEDKNFISKQQAKVFSGPLDTIMRLL